MSVLFVVTRSNQVNLISPASRITSGLFSTYALTNTFSLMISCAALAGSTTGATMRVVPRSGLSARSRVRLVAPWLLCRLVQQKAWLASHVVRHRLRLSAVLQFQNGGFFAKWVGGCFVPQEPDRECAEDSKCSEMRSCYWCSHGHKHD